jgi:hypothetical protein
VLRRHARAVVTTVQREDGWNGNQRPLLEGAEFAWRVRPRAHPCASLLVGPFAFEPGHHFGDLLLLSIYDLLSHVLGPLIVAVL